MTTKKLFGRSFFHGYFLKKKTLSVLFFDWKKLAGGMIMVSGLFTQARRNEKNSEGGRGRGAVIKKI